MNWLLRIIGVELVRAGFGLLRDWVRDRRARKKKELDDELARRAQEMLDRYDVQRIAG